MWEEEIFFENCKEYISQISLWIENFDEIALSCTVKEIVANLCFSIFGKNIQYVCVGNAVSKIFQKDVHLLKSTILLTYG